MTTIYPPRLTLSADVVALTGATYRQLDYWVRTGVVTPERNPGGAGTGHERGFTSAQVEGIRRLVLTTRLLGAFPSAIARRIFEEEGPWSVSEAGRTATLSIGMTRGES